MAARAKGLMSLARTAMKESEGALQAAAKRNASSEARWSSNDGKYSPGLFTRTKPIDRSHNWMAKNPYIEAWYYRRDHFEKEFAWNFRNTVEAAWLLGGFTAGFWYLSVWCTDHASRRSGYPKRAYLGDEPGFVLPDEREFY